MTILRGLITLSLLLAATFWVGCILPVPVFGFPSPSVGSGKLMEFRDKEANLIRCDGWVIITRLRSFRWGQVEPSCHMVKVAGGVARIPHEVVFSSAWLYPNSMGWASFLLTIPPVNLLALPLCAIPEPRIEPHERLAVMPLISGYYIIHRDDDSLDSAYAWWFDSPGKQDVIWVPLSPNDARAAEYYWKGVKRLVTGPTKSEWGSSGFPVMLEPRHMEFALAIINAELRHLTYQPPPAAFQPVEQ